MDRLGAPCINDYRLDALDHVGEVLHEDCDVLVEELVLDQSLEHLVELLVKLVENVRKLAKVMRYLD